jgi:hypothetical protein
MKKRQREALLVALARALRDEGSWCGETHLQKATYVLEGLLKVPLGFEHVLYKYGPFASDVREELATMRADGFLESQSSYPYGPRLGRTSRSSRSVLGARASASWSGSQLPSGFARRCPQPHCRHKLRASARSSLMSASRSARRRSKTLQAGSKKLTIYSRSRQARISLTRSPSRLRVSARLGQVAESSPAAAATTAATFSAVHDRSIGTRSTL